MGLTHFLYYMFTPWKNLNSNIIPHRIEILKCHLHNTKVRVEFNQKEKYIKNQRLCDESYVNFLCLVYLLISKKNCLNPSLIKAYTYLIVLRNKRMKEYTSHRNSYLQHLYWAKLGPCKVKFCFLTNKNLQEARWWLWE